MVYVMVIIIQESYELMTLIDNGIMMDIDYCIDNTTYTNQHNQ